MKILKVVKRDDSVQAFNFEKIREAVKKAFISTNNSPESLSEASNFIDYLDAVFNKINSEEINVEDIQNIIQKELIKKNKYDVVENFILYRNKRAEARQRKTKLSKDIKKALEASNIQNQNANVDEASFGGRIGEAGRVVCKDAALKMMSRTARKNHEDGWIYIHDLDSYAAGMHNCLSVPLDMLLKHGFNTRQTDVRGANSLNTAFQLVAVLFQLQSLQQFGGVSATHIDWTMVPYFRKSFYKHYIDGLKYSEGWSDKKIAKFNKSLGILSEEDLNDNNIFQKFIQKIF